MRNIKLIIEYDGTNYAGWQVQPNGVSIQETMETALGALLKGPVRLHSSGRTDAGVHARGMVATFSTDSMVPLRAFSDGLNSLLPPDIAVASSEEVPLEFHPRFDARGKHYRYSLYRGGRRSPLARLCAWHVRGELDLAAMREAAKLMVGEHDFASFRTAGCAAKTTVRRIDAVDVGEEGGFLRVDVRGSGFLRNMVRMMVGTLVEVGRGRRTPEAVALLLSHPGSSSAGPTAPPHGLCLEEVYY
ncbi:tRNA pseudouridine(38-40) synthase TruA [Geobacter pickeringii]|uniref:tRNA pseudouridine synthase A n=1 Tax=Geobacter pickeringii TaxID=345632 RepID=A0A0B5BBW5_9BACT|nr:tRNA pseudouridine(38-40) synthase TruA [Geobacter pickeringii]AJE02514.1 pseudouridine synthase [Geobacter pickeringii]